MKTVYLLWHTHISSQLTNGEDIKLIGVYSSIELAYKAKERTALLEGFKDAIEGFEIAEHKIDEDGWTSGFITVYCKSKPRT